MLKKIINFIFKRGDDILSGGSGEHTTDSTTEYNATKSGWGNLYKKETSPNTSMQSSSATSAQPIRSKFNIGDVVCLKSGGPKMTVSSIKFSAGIWGLPSSFIIVCTGFNYKNEIQIYEFDQNLLEISNR